MTKKLSLAFLTAALCVVAPLTHAETVIVGKHTNTTTGGGTDRYGHHRHRGDSGDGSHKDTGDKHKKSTTDPIPDPPPQN